MKPGAISPLLSTLIILLALLSFGQSASSQEQQRIAAVVNEDIVSTNELIERLNLAIFLSGLPNDRETRQGLAPQVLRRSIDERLQIQEADRLAIDVTQGEVASALDRVAEPSGMETQQFLELLAGRGISRSLIEQQIRAELAWNKIIRRQISNRITVTDSQVEMELASEIEEGSDEVLLSEILLPIYSPEEETEALAEAERLVQAIRGGADFAGLAEQVSASSTAERGGQIGWVPISAMSAEVRQVVSNLQPGQISSPLRTPAGVQILVLQDRRVGAAPSSDPNARRIAQILMPVQTDASNQAAEVIFGRANELRRSLNNCADVVRVANELRTPASGDLGWIRMRDLSPQLSQVLGALPIESISQPIRSENGFHLVMVCAIGGEDAQNDQAQREQIRRRLEQEQIQRLANRFLRDLRKTAFIDVRIGS